MDDPIARLRDEVESGPHGSKLARIEEIAVGSGIKAKTLRNLIYGASKTTSYEKAAALAAYFDARDKARRPKSKQAAAA